MDRVTEDALLMEHLDEGREPFEIVLRGHLWIESALVAIIGGALEHPEVIDLDRVNFAQKIRWAVGLGVVPKDTMRVLNTLNKLRNGLAHNVRWEFTQHDARALVEAAPSRISSMLQYTVESGDLLPDADPVSRARMMILCLHATLVADAQRFQAAKKDLAEAYEHLADVLAATRTRTVER